MTYRQSIHCHDCWGWGPKHYECVVGQIVGDKAMLRQALEEYVQRDDMHQLIKKKKKKKGNDSVQYALR